MHDGTFGGSAIGLDFLNRSTALGQGYSFFTNTPSPAAPTCTLAAGGALVADTTYYIRYGPVYVGNGSEGQASLSCTATPSGSNLEIVATVPAAISGQSGVYSWYIGTSSIGGADCGQGGSPHTFTYDCHDVGLGNGPLDAAGGPAGIHGDTVWASVLTLGKPANVPTGDAYQRARIYLEPSDELAVFQGQQQHRLRLRGSGRQRHGDARHRRDRCGRLCHRCHRIGSGSSDERSRQQHRLGLRGRPDRNCRLSTWGDADHREVSHG